MEGGLSIEKKLFSVRLMRLVSISSSWASRRYRSLCQARPILNVGHKMFDDTGSGPFVQNRVTNLRFIALFTSVASVSRLEAVPWKRLVMMTAAAMDAILLIAAMPTVARAAGPYIEYTLTWHNTERHYLLRVPPHAGDRPLPLVIGLHGFGDSAREFADATQLWRATDATGMMAAFPMSVDRKPGKQSFNAKVCCGSALKNKVDDIGFIGAIIDDIATHHALDRSRVYATGHSNGATLVYELAALHPDWFAAIAVQAGRIGGGTPDGKNYVLPSPSLPVPVMIIHGTDDPVVPYDGGRAPSNQPYLWALSVADAVHFWASVDRCEGPDVMPKRVSRQLSLTEYKHCARGSVVKLWTVEGGDHSWPGDIFPTRGGTHSASTEIVDFFKRFRREPHP